MAHVVMGPVVVEDPSLILQTFSKGRPRKWREDGEVGKLHVVLLNELHGAFKYRRIVLVKPEDEGPLDADLMGLDRLDQIG